MVQYVSKLVQYLSKPVQDFSKLVQYFPIWFNIFQTGSICFQTGSIFFRLVQDFTDWLKILKSVNRDTGNTWDHFGTLRDYSENWLEIRKSRYWDYSGLLRDCSGTAPRTGLKSGNHDTVTTKCLSISASKIFCSAPRHNRHIIFHICFAKRFYLLNFTLNSADIRHSPAKTQPTYDVPYLFAKHFYLFLIELQRFFAARQGTTAI